MDEVALLRKRFEDEDRYHRALGIKLLDLKAGQATLSMTIDEKLYNFQGSGHGGAIFSLADTAFGLACNSHGYEAVALTASIDYCAPARPGDTLTATAVETRRTRRTGYCDITVTGGDGALIATMRGISYRKD